MNIPIFGLHFLDGDDRTVNDSVAYSTDTFGSEGGPREGDVSFVTLQFAQPVRNLGVDFPGALRSNCSTVLVRLAAAQLWLQRHRILRRCDLGYSL